MHFQIETLIHNLCLCSTSKLANHKFGLYHPLTIPMRPRESISMDLISGLSMIFHKHEYNFVVVRHFSKMSLFIPCMKTTSTSQILNLFSLLSGHTLVFHSKSCLIEILVSSLLFGRKCGNCWVACLATPLLSTLKLMAKLRWLTIALFTLYACIILNINNGTLICISLNIVTIILIIILLVSAPLIWL